MRHRNLKLSSFCLLSLLTVAGPVHATMISAQGANLAGSDVTTAAGVDATALQPFVTMQSRMFIELPVESSVGIYLRTRPIGGETMVGNKNHDEGNSKSSHYEDEDVIGNCLTHCSEHRHVEVSAVALPGALWLLLSGLMAMGIDVRRKFDITT